jgi:hypothetical protein
LYRRRHGHPDGLEDLAPYALALASDGKALAILFYGNALELLQSCCADYPTVGYDAYSRDFKSRFNQSTFGNRVLLSAELLGHISRQMGWTLSSRTAPTTI